MESPSADSATLSEKLLRHAGAIGDLPDDAAEQLDHYLYGIPKR